MNLPDLYKKEYIDKTFERKELFILLRDTYKIKNALYPGSFVHITPSLVFSAVVYIDSDKNAKRFFDETQSIKQFIHQNKTYAKESDYRFIHQDYAAPLELPTNYFDLLISQWAGPVSQACKKYLKRGGYLLANNSHADAGIAFLDEDYEFISAIHYSNPKYRITEKDLGSYFIPKSTGEVTKEALLKSGQGIGYKKTANAYVFRKK